MDDKYAELLTFQNKAYKSKQNNFQKITHQLFKFSITLTMTHKTKSLSCTDFSDAFYDLITT